MLPEIIRTLSFLLPIPFMALFYIKTNKLDFMKKYGILTLFIPIFLNILSSDFGYHLDLTFAYMIFVLFGAHIFSQKVWTYPQALSLSFCLTYFASFLWELPTHIYTIIVRGGVDGAFPLHLLFIFPIIFIYEKVQTNQSRKEVYNILVQIIGYSTLSMIVLLLSGIDIWNVAQNPQSGQIVEEALWMVNRMVVVIGLFYIYSKSTLRKEKHDTV